MTAKITHKSPFLVIQNFISPLACEEIVNSIPHYNITHTNKIDKENPEKVVFKEICFPFISKPIAELIPRIESYYDVNCKKIEDPFIEWFPAGSTGKLGCDSSEYVNRKWIRDTNRDFSGVIFLSDYNPKIPFDKNYEVYGGKLEFPQHGFAFQPERGTLIVYPSGPHFINFTSEVKFGDLYQIKFFIENQKIFLYYPADFQGDYSVWFKEIK